MAETYMLDLVENALGRAKDGLPKDELQKETGLGTGDLRGAVASLVEEGVVIERDGGVLALSPGVPVGADVDGLGDAADEAAEEDDREVAEEEPERADASVRLPTAGGAEERYRASLIVSAEFGGPGPDGELDGDSFAVRGASNLAEWIEQHLAGAFGGGIEVTARVDRVEAYTAPRRVL